MDIDDPGALPETVADRYHRDRLLGVGGMGCVWRVYDTWLARHVALKVVRPDRATPHDLGRFEEEARIAASLQHPGIVPVHDLGVLADGRLWFTMHEVQGRGLDERAREAHRLWRLGRVESGAGSFRRLLEAFLRVCETVAYAHSRGIVHRDLKPANVMLGEYGEVFVLDWGLAKIGSDPELGSDPRPGGTTRVGAIMGTPHYLAPEQAQGRSSEVTARSDVHALGATLYDLLCERPPRVARSVDRLLRAIAFGTAVRPPSFYAQGPPIDEALDAICLRAVAIDPADRYPDAGALAADLARWLDGARSREQAAALVEEAEHRIAASRAHGAEAEAHAAEARRLLAPLAADADADAKTPAWAAEDAARSHETSARAEHTAAVQALRAALSHVPDLTTAHDRLAELFHDVHRSLEATGRVADAEAAEADLRLHDRAGRYGGYLTGIGALTLVTSEPCEARLHRWVERGRRLCPDFVRSLGTTPLAEVPLDRGSWLVTLHREGHDAVRYPVHIARGEHWHGVPPDGTEPFPVFLPPTGLIGDDERYVPAGWFWSGDDELEQTLPLARLWADGFAIGRFPVTVGEYVRYLNDLLDAGEAAAEAEPLLGDADEPLFARDPEGRYVGIRRDRHGAGWDLVPFDPDTPVASVDWFQANRYAERFGRRLPMEREWQKAARGADRRRYPWGDHFEPTWCRMSMSAPITMIVPVTAYPVDESVYGVRGLAGNVADWAADAAPEPQEARDSLRVLVGTRDAANRYVVGGACGSAPQTCQTSQRVRFSPSSRAIRVGFRVCRTIG